MHVHKTGHSLECQTSGAVLYESKEGSYHPLEEDEVMNANVSRFGEHEWTRRYKTLFCG